MAHRCRLKKFQTPSLYFFAFKADNAASLFLERVSDGLESVHNSSARKILSTKACLQGKKRSKVPKLARIFNVASAFLSHNIAA